MITRETLGVKGPNGRVAGCCIVDDTNHADVANYARTFPDGFFLIGTCSFEGEQESRLFFCVDYKAAQELMPIVIAVMPGQVTWTAYSIDLHRTADLQPKVEAI